MHKPVFFRYLAYYLILLLLFVLQTTPNLLPPILGSKPLLLIPAALTISYMEAELPAMFFGLAAGLMLDFGYSDNIGFFTFALTVVCFGVSVFFRDNLVVSFLNAMAFTAAISTLLLILWFVFSYIIAGKGDVLYYFVHHYIARIVYTIAVEPVLYFIFKFLFKNLRSA